jgi:hypothetical protein
MRGSVRSWYDFGLALASVPHEKLQEFRPMDILGQTNNIPVSREGCTLAVQELLSRDDKGRFRHGA